MDNPRDHVFFGISEAAELAIRKWGYAARCWNWDRGIYGLPPEPDHRCEIGTGGAGASHVVCGYGDNWVDAARMAGLFDPDPTPPRAPLAHGSSESA